jgi:C1A family cysteine protease
MAQANLPVQRIKRYGWVPDLPDARDHLYAAPLFSLGALPAKVDLRKQCPKDVYDQGQLGSCTGNAIACAVQYDRIKQKLANAQSLTPSRLFIYFNERTMENSVAQDNGAQIRDGIKSIAKAGVCFEQGTNSWPYDIKKFAQTPPAACFKAALSNLATQYSRLVATAPQLRGCLASGYPFVFGFSVYEGFESAAVAKSGVVSMPGAKEKLLGGHAVIAVGYDDAQQRFLVRNSWGPKWGQAGYFTIPYQYLTDTNLADDFWTVRMVKDPAMA